MIPPSARRTLSLAGLALCIVGGAESCRFPKETIDCVTRGDCTDELDGRCDVRTARCVYPDESCPGSRLHYGRYTTGRGQCVPPGDGGPDGMGGASGSGGRSGGGQSGSLTGGDASADGGSPTTGVDGGETGAILELVAGRLGGFGSIDGVGSGARFLFPSGVAYDGVRYLYIADSGSGTIRRVDSDTAEVLTVAGNTSSADLDGGGRDPTFADPVGVVFEAPSTLYVSDFSFARISKIDLVTRAVETIVTNPPDGSGLQDGVGAEVRLGAPDDMARGAASTLYFADATNNVVRTLDLATKRVTTIAGDAVDGASGNTDGAAAAARFEHPHGLAYDGANQRLFISEYDGGRVRALDLKTSTVSTLVSGIESPSSLLYDPATDRLLVAAHGTGRVLDIDVKQKTWTALVTRAGPGFEVGESGTDMSAPLGIARTASDTLFVTDEFGCTLRKMVANASKEYEVFDFVGLVEHAGYTDAVGDAARFNVGGDMVLSEDGKSLYIVDRGNDVVRLVELATAEVSTFAGSGVAGTVDGKGKAAQLEGPIAITQGVPEPGKPAALYLTQSNGAVRKIDLATATVSTLWAGGAAPLTGWVEGIAATATTLFVSYNQSLYQLPVGGGTPALLVGASEQGCVDGPFATASLGEPQGLLWDGATHLFVADTSCQSIRRIDLGAGTVETVAGGEQPGVVDGKGKAARFMAPWSLASNRERTGFFVADQYIVRFVDAKTFQVTTIVGDPDQASGVRLSPGAPQLGYIQGLLEAPNGELYLTSENALLRYRPGRP